MINKFLDIIINMSNYIYVKAWKIRYSKTRIERYKKNKNKKFW